MWPLKSFTQEFSTRGYKRRRGGDRRPLTRAVRVNHHIPSERTKRRCLDSSYQTVRRLSKIWDRVIRVDKLAVEDLE